MKPWERSWTDDAPATAAKPWEKDWGGAPKAKSSAPELRPNEETMEQPQGGAVGRAASGLWDTTLGGLGKAIKTLGHFGRMGLTGTPDLDAIQDAHDLVQAHIDQARKAKDAWSKGEHVEAVGHGLAAATPLIGPAAAHAGEVAGGEAPVLDKYGNVVQKGKAPDIARAVGEGVGLAASSSPKNIVSPSVRATGTAVSRAASAAGLPEALERSAGKSYRKMLTPTAKDVVPEAEAIAGGPSPSGPTGLVKDRPVALTRKGMMTQAEAKMREVGPKTATAYEGKAPLDPSPVLNHLEELRRQKAVVKGTDVVSDPALNSAIDELKQNILDMRGQNGRIAPASLDDLVDKLNRGLVSPKGHMRALSPQTSSAIERSLAGNIRGYLDKAYPDAAKINASYRTARGTKTFLEEQRRAQIAAESGVRTGSSSGFGAALKKAIPAPLRGLPNAISTLTDSVAWDSVSGATKAKIADLIRRGSLDAAANEMKSLPRLRSVLPPSKTKAVIEENTRSRATASQNAGPEWWEQQPPTRPEIQARYEQIFNQAENLSPQLRVSVPETGVPEGVARGVDARQNLARKLLNKEWAELGNPERIAIDQLVSEGYGSVPQYAKGGVIRRPTLLVDAETREPSGIMGEAGPEAIVPLTAERGTTPEAPDTLDVQLEQLAQGLRRVVMVPRGTDMPRRPKGTKAYMDEFGNAYIFDPAETSQQEIDAAIQGNQLPELLGAAEGGMGAPDKSELSSEAVAVVGRDAKGRTAQATATDKTHIRKTVKQTAKVTPKGGKLTVESPEKEIRHRINAEQARSPRWYERNRKSQWFHKA